MDFRGRHLESIHQLAAMLHAHHNVLTDLNRQQAVDYDEGLVVLTPAHLVRLQRARMHDVKNEVLKRPRD